MLLFLCRMALEDEKKRSVVELTLLQTVVAMMKIMETLVAVVGQQKEQLTVLQNQFAEQTNDVSQSGNTNKRQGQQNDDQENKKVACVVAITMKRNVAH